jgi:hypothetical protein
MLLLVGVFAKAFSLKEGSYNKRGVGGSCTFDLHNISTRVARFFLVQYTKKGKNIPNDNKIYTKWPKNRPNVQVICRHLLLQDPTKFTQIWIFCLKIYHLATLISTG